MDKEVVTDNVLVTSRKPEDIPAFNREMIALFWGNRGCEQRTRKENRVGPAYIQRDAGSTWFLAEPVSDAVTNLGDCSFPLASR